MKRFILLTLITGSTLLSCSKKSNPSPQTGVTIGGTNYATVKIGTQTWTSVNYNGTGGVNYNNGSNDPNYGKLYTLVEANAISLPSGWRLPTKADAEKLLTYLGATGTGTIGVEGDSTISIKLKSKTGWTFKQGSNSSGFNTFPAGAYDSVNLYYGVNTLASFWTSTADASSDQYILGVTNEQSGPSVIDYTGIDYIPTNQVANARISIRFVRDN